ncbi:MAG TPA: thiol-disulfide isomerase [Blastocatellia bacterium]|nr:thiol-disulfide isomerase [Blastocatellia bacterium]
MKRTSAVTLIATLIVAVVFLFQLSTSASDKLTSSVTFTKDVASILHKNCATCHRAGEIAPMSLLTFKDVRPWAKSIREVVVERRMPPWLADPNHGEFKNDSRLSQKDIDTIVAWVDGGAKEGDPKDMPKAPTFPSEGWKRGTPDVVLSMTVEASVPSDGVVAYRHFAVPTNFTEDKYVQFAEIKRGDPAVVHHVIVSVREPGQGPMPAPGEINLGAAANRDGEARTAQQPGQGGGRGNTQDGMLVGWAPGMSPLSLRDGQAKLIKKGSMLIFQMHYTTNGVASKDRTSVGLYFAKAPVEKRVITTGAVARNLVIPPGEPNYESKSSFTFSQDSHIVSFMPHMHVRGKDFEYKLVYPDGTSKILLKVPRYDFNWQLVYFIKEPVAAPKGSRIECVAHHDNSERNKFNPDPSKEVRWGPQTWEEMMIGWLDFTIDGQNLRNETATR